MSEITVKVFANLRELIGTKEVKLFMEEESPFLIQVLNALVSKYPQIERELFVEKKTWNDVYRVFYQGQNVSPSDFGKIKINEKEIVILPPSGGG